MPGLRLIERFTRRKYLSPDDLASTTLKRTLTTLDLTALGIGSTLGVGVYVLAGEVAKNDAGPSVVLSFLVAAIASVFAGLCYAEFGARVPRAGSAYVYSYVCVGEIVAFIIGWNLILEYVIGTASVARGYSGYLDSLLDNRMQNAFRNITPIHDWVDNKFVAEYLSPYVDFFAFGICIVLSSLLSFGVKESSKFNNTFTVLNLLVVCYVIICGAFKADIKNWRIDPNNTTIVGQHDSAELGQGGFFPFGISGMLAGAATCFYGFIGFDAVATTGEETKDPQKSIPIAIVLSLAFIFFSYFGISTVLTMMWPYYDQDPQSPLPTVFDAIGWPSARWIVSIGALFGLSTSLLGAMFPLPRVVYAMANDGLIFRFLAKVHPKSQTPVLATMLAGLFGGFMAAIFDLAALVDMMSIGTLLAYSLVAICVLILRYEMDATARNKPEAPNVSSRLIDASKKHSFGEIVKQLFNAPGLKTPSALSSKIASWGSLSMAFLFLGVNAVLIFKEDAVTGADGNEETWPKVLLSIFVVLALVNVFAIYRQPQSGQKLGFKVPLVPLIPALSVWINIYLMMKLSDKTWQRFAVWMVIGLLIYFAYGVRNSSEGKRRQSLVESAKKTFRDTWILDGIENGAYVKGKEEEDDGDGFTAKITIESDEEDENDTTAVVENIPDDREVITVFKPDSSIIIRPRQGEPTSVIRQKRRRSSVKPLPRVEELPEIRVMTATPPPLREIKLGQTSIEEVEQEFVEELKTGTADPTDDLHRQISASASSGFSEEEEARSGLRGQTLAEETLQALAEVEEFYDSAVGPHRHSSSDSSTFSGEEVEFVSRAMSESHSRVSAAMGENQDSGFDSQLSFLHETIQRVITDQDYDGFERGKALSAEFLLKTNSSLTSTPVLGLEDVAARRRKMSLNVSPIDQQYAVTYAHAQVGRHFTIAQVEPYLGSDVSVEEEEAGTIEEIHSSIQASLNRNSSNNRGKSLALAQMRRDFMSFYDPSYAPAKPTRPAPPPSSDEEIEQVEDASVAAHVKIAQALRDGKPTRRVDSRIQECHARISACMQRTWVDSEQRGQHLAEEQRKRDAAFQNGSQLRHDNRPPVAPRPLVTPEELQHAERSARAAHVKIAASFGSRQSEVPLPSEQMSLADLDASVQSTLRNDWQSNNRGQKLASQQRRSSKPSVLTVTAEQLQTPPPRPPMDPAMAAAMRKVHEAIVGSVSTVDVEGNNEQTQVSVSQAGRSLVDRRQVQKKFPLERNASFDVIPPAAMDSPGAKRVDEKFVVIPVAKTDEDDGSITEDREVEEPSNNVAKMLARLGQKARRGAVPPPPDFSPPPPPVRPPAPPPQQMKPRLSTREPVQEEAPQKQPRLLISASLLTSDAPPPPPPPPPPQNLLAGTISPTNFNDRRALFQSADRPKSPVGAQSPGFTPPSAAQLTLMKKSLVKPPLPARSSSTIISVNNKAEPLKRPFSVPAKQASIEKPAPPKEEANGGSEPSGLFNVSNLRARFEK